MFVPLNRVAHFMPIRLHKYGSIYVEGATVIVKSIAEEVQFALFTARCVQML